MANRNSTNDDEEVYLERVNQFSQCFVVRGEHLTGMQDWCRFLAKHRVLRVVFLVGQEHHARRWENLINS